MSKPTRSCTSFGVEQAALILNGFVVPKSTLEDIPGDTEMLFGLTDAIEEELLAATDTAPAPKSHGTGRESVFSATLKERAVRLAFAIYKRNGDKWKKGWPTKVEADTGVPRQTVVRWIGGHTSVDSCVAAVLAVRKGHGTVTPADIEAALYEHIIKCWKLCMTPTKAYIMAQWFRLCRVAGVEWKNFDGMPSEVAYRRYCETWHLTERVPTTHKYRRLRSENPDNIRGFFEGKDEQIGDTWIHWRGLKEALLLPCDTRDGKCLSFADKLAMGAEVLGNGDEICLIRAACETKAVGPADALAFARVCDGDREAITAFVSGGVFGTLNKRYYIKKGKIWTQNYMRCAEKGSKMILKEGSYVMDGDVMVQVLQCLAKDLGVTPEHRYLMLLDGHGSRLEKAVVDAALKLGFVLLLLPGALTHLLQPFDQIFQEMRRVMCTLLAYKRCKNYGVISTEEWIGIVEQSTKAAFEGPDGVRLLKWSFAVTGVWPVDPEAPVNRAKAKQEGRRGTVYARPVPKTLPSQDEGVQNVLSSVMPRTGKRKLLETMVGVLDGEADKENEAGPRKKKGGRMAVEHPSLMGGDEVEEAELARKRLRDANAAAAKQTKAAESAAKKAVRMAATAEKNAATKAALASAKAAKVAAKAVSDAAAAQGASNTAAAAPKPPRKPRAGTAGATADDWRRAPVTMVGNPFAAAHPPVQ
jgi:hypothetical protein